MAKAKKSKDTEIQIRCSYDELVPIGELKPNPENPNQHPEKQIAVLEVLIQTDGFRNAVVVSNQSGFIVSGHGRLLAAKKIGMPVVPVDFQDYESKEQELAILMSDNIVAELSEFDSPMAGRILTKLQEAEYDLTLTGLDEDEINRILDQLNIEEPSDEDEIPEPPIDPITKLGDLWLLSEHRVLCGDATKKEDVERLMNGKKANIAITDPPYSVNYESRKEKPDKTLKSYIDPQDAEKLLEGFISLLPTTGLVMTYADKQLHPYVRVCDKLGFETIDLLIWVKQNFCFWPGARYQQQHELIFLLRKKGSKFFSNTYGNSSTVINVERQMRNDMHPTIRPLSLWLDLIHNHSKINDLIYDPFLGSGTTVIGAEKVMRKCYGLEISPAFCDVIVKRWENYTGKKAILEKKRNKKRG